MQSECVHLLGSQRPSLGLCERGEPGQQLSDKKETLQ